MRLPEGASLMELEVCFVAGATQRLNLRLSDPEKRLTFDIPAQRRQIIIDIPDGNGRMLVPSKHRRQDRACSFCLDCLIRSQHRLHRGPGVIRIQGHQSKQVRHQPRAQLHNF